MKVDTWSLRREFEHEGPGRYPTRSYPEQYIFYVSIYPEKDYSYKKDFLNEQQNCICIFIYDGRAVNLHQAFIVNKYRLVFIIRLFSCHF